MDWIADLREKKTPQTTADMSLPRDTSTDSEECAAPEAKQTVPSGWRAFTLFSLPTSQESAPVTPEPKHYRQQSRDYEKTPPSNHDDDDSQSAGGEQERVDVPSCHTPITEKSIYHNLMSSATDAWILSQSSSASASNHKNEAGSSTRSSKADNEPKEVESKSPHTASELKNIHGIMASATDEWILSQSSSLSASNHDIDQETSTIEREEPVDEAKSEDTSPSGYQNIDEMGCGGKVEHGPFRRTILEQGSFEDINIASFDETNEDTPIKDLESEDALSSMSIESMHDSGKGGRELEDMQEDDSTILTEHSAPSHPIAESPSLEDSLSSMESEEEEPPVTPKPIPTAIKINSIPPCYSLDSLDSNIESELEELLSSPDHIPADMISDRKSTCMDDLDSVFIRDHQYSWIPAKVVDYQRDYAVVAINLPKSWVETTMLEDDANFQSRDVHTSMKDVRIEDRKRLESKYGIAPSQLRKVWYNDYENHDLPYQNEEEGKRDMADLVELHFAAILYNLKARHFQQKPYTRVGDIVIAMNPFCWIKELYEPATRDMYSENLIWEARRSPGMGVSEFVENKNEYERIGFEPHVYEVSALAYRGLATTGQDQTILVTGESGAGKTETVKIVMNHLATVQQTRPGGLPAEHSPAKEIVARVLKSSPIFEAFGNAKTVRNDNSSRFGKFTQLQFQVEALAVADAAGREIPFADLVGSNCTTYLLEKNRVVSHDEGERTFHIFYQLLAASREFKQSLWPVLTDRTAECYSYTAGDIGIVASDAAGWEETLAALGTFRFQEDSLTTLLRALVIVLQLGNLIFDHAASGSEEHNTVIKNKDELVELSKLMGINESYLQECLTSRSLKTPGGHDDIKVKLSPQNAKESCDAFAKEIYAKIFQVLVQKINSYTAYPESLLDSRLKCGHISLLDIFGFERFETNRFEQLCINYANERLHNKYVLDNFNEVKEEYEAEGIDLYDFKLVDNSDILSLLEGSPGLIAALDEECLRPKGNAEAFVYKSKIAHKGSTRLIDYRLHRKWEFGILHFTGPVEYDAQNFVSRNADKLPVGLVECAAKSQNTLIGDAFKLLIVDGRSNSPRAKHSKKRAPNDTVLHKFQGQLKSLVAAMEGTKTRYIRCIKPNGDMVPRKMNHATTMQQLECSGLMTALTISRESFPNKLPYDFIMKRYACLMRGEELKTYEDLAPHQQVERMLVKWLKPLSMKSRNGTRRAAFACGKTKVFFKAGAQDALEQHRAQFYESSAVRIQATVRRLNAKATRTRMEACVCNIQSFARMTLVSLQLKSKHEAATTLSCWIRGRWALQLLDHLQREKAVRNIQSCARMLIVRMRLQRRHQSTTKIAAWIRGIFAIQLLKCLKGEKATMAIQRYTRGYLVRMELAARKRSVHTIQIAARQFLKDTTAEQMAVKKGEPEELSPEFQETFEYLREEIASLQSENDKLKCKVASLNTERKNLKIEKESSSAAVATYKARARGLVKANDALVKELLTARQETSNTTRELQAERSQLETKLSMVESELKNTKRMHEKEIHELRKANEETQLQHAEMQRRHEQELFLAKERYEYQKDKMKDDLKAIEQSHKKQLSGFVDVIGKGQSKRQDEVAKLTAELLAVRREKDGQISRLQQELKALRVPQGGQSRNVRAAIEPRVLQNQLSGESELRTRRAAEFDDACRYMQSLISQSCVLPRFIPKRDMPSIIEQQERGQRMSQVLEKLCFLFKTEEDSQHQTSEAALALVKEYVAATEPNRTLSNLQGQLAKANIQNSQLREALQEKGYCQRCAALDSSN